MSKHIDVYRKAFNIGEQDRDSVLCEVCSSPQCQIHHIEMKGMGGNPELNYIENLIALCKNCHDIAHGKITGKELTREQLFDIIAERQT